MNIQSLVFILVFGSSLVFGQTELPGDDATVDNGNLVPIHEEDFVESGVKCCGFPEDVDTNVEGVDVLVDTTLRQVLAAKNKRHSLVKILRLQRQVVAGILYTLTVEIAPTLCDSGTDLSSFCPLDETASSLICEVKFIDPPGMGRDKQLLGNNCTDNFVPEGAANGFVAQYPTEKTPKKPENPDWLSELESQVETEDDIAKVEPLAPTPPETVETEDQNVRKAIEDLIVPDQKSSQSNAVPELHGGYYDWILPPTIVTYALGPRKQQQHELRRKYNPYTDISLEGLFIPYMRLQPEYNPNSDLEMFTDINENDQTKKSTTFFFPGMDVDMESADQKPTMDSSEQNSRNLVSQEKDYYDLPYLYDFLRNFPLKTPLNIDLLVNKGSIYKGPTKPTVHRHKRSLGRYEKISIQEKPLVRQLADVAANILDSKDDDNYRNVVLQILGAKKLKVDGVYYSMILKMGISRCPEDIGTYDECREQLFENYMKNCKVLVLADEDLNNSKLAKSKCLNIRKDNDKNRTNYSRYRRDVNESPAAASANVEALQYLRSSIKLWDNESGHPNKLKIKEIISVTTHVVSGTFWKIRAEVIASKCLKTDSREAHDCEDLPGSETRICTFKVWDRPWLPHGKETDIKCDNEQTTHKFRSRRNAITEEPTKMPLEVQEDLDSRPSQETLSEPNVNLPIDSPEAIDTAKKAEGQLNRHQRSLTAKGAPRNVSTDDPEAIEYVKSGLILFDADSDHSNKLKLKKILSATRQVVSGSKWVIMTELVPSDCLKTSSKLADECGELLDAPSRFCEFTVWDQPWLPNGKETTVRCQNEVQSHTYRSRRSINTHNLGRVHLLGAPAEESISNPKAIKYVFDGLLHLDSNSNENNKLKIQEILSVTKQIVSGQKWRIRARIILSDCSKNDQRQSHECGELEGAQSKICDFEIWDQPWLPNGKQTDIKCENEDKTHTFRAKRSLGEKYLIPSSIDGSAPNPQVYDYVQAALEYLDSQSGFDTSYALKEILGTSKQTVAGTLWHIKASIGLSDCIKNSDAKFCQPTEVGTKICNFKVWEMLWIPQKQINITCENDNQEYTFLHIPKTKVTDLSAKKQFKDFIKTHNKNYESKVEYERRFRIFRENLKTIEKLNLYEQGTGKYGVTKFADLSQEEFSKSHGLRNDLRSENEIPFVEAKIPDIEIPTEFDWRKKKVVTEVKDQGQCGSCWAFSVTGNVEGQYALKHGNLLEFSEQELVDCDTTDSGCNGGLMDNAYRSIEKMGGLELESDYPYEAEDEKCHFNKDKARVQLSGALNISTDETNMAKWLVANGPISIAINANAMQFYVGGVSHPWKMLCNPKNLDHGVLIVGYGVHVYPLFNKTMPYWIVKNSWGPSWGEQGYYRVFRGDGTCGVNQTPSSAIVE